MAVTIHDLARLSGYNASTISRALRGDKRVKESTRRRIIELAERHGYTPNLPARQLARGKTGNIWCCFGFAEAERERNLAVRLDELLYHRGYDLQIVLHNNSPERFRQWLRKLHQKVADAAVLIPPGNTEECRELVPLINALPVPHLSLDRFWPELTCPVITTDNFSAARHLVDRCLEWGAREFYLEFGDVNPVLRARERAIRERLRERTGPGTVPQDHPLPAELRSDCRTGDGAPPLHAGVSAEPGPGDGGGAGGIVPGILKLNAGRERKRFPAPVFPPRAIRI